MKKTNFKQSLAVYGSTYIDGTRIEVQGINDLTENEARAYIAKIREEYPNETIESLTIKAEDGGNVSLDYTIRPMPFQRIRRITGYLVGDINRWGNAKRAEERDRVKHTEKVDVI